ncbi:MAG: rhodanese-like domain-containing protein [Betaproteobacteria bacterium]
MSLKLSYRYITTIACITFMMIAIFITPPAIAATDAKSSLVTVAWLEKNLGNKDIVLLDASPASRYAAKHIPGALNVDVFSFGGREAPAAEMEKRFQSWGISRAKRIVIYDQGGTYFATSLFFDLYYHGFPPDKLVVLDGGLSKWQAGNGVVTKDATPAPRPGNFRVVKVKEDVRARLPEFMAASGDPKNNAIVEALDMDYHFGSTKFFDRAGHVPHAISAPNPDFYNADKTFKSPEEIQRMLTYLGVKPDQQVYSHCGGGIAASVPFFAAKMMLNYPKVKLYKESQLEWLRDDRTLPFWTYDAPNLQREKTWLASWGHPMMRQFGVAKLSVVDVRTPEAYKLGHVPYAVNIPAEIFKQNMSTPAKLAEYLGAAGVDPNYEAVIVSEGGVNANSALAFLMLEKMGQKKISVLTEGVDDWALGGLQLVKEATTIGKAKSPQDMAVPATTYPVDVRAGIVTADAPRADALYPKIYISSGRNVSAKIQDGKILHVPYTDLVNAEGAPKPAKEIWNILVKAGLPRYAEIICFADEPGDAAANYFILKLMGYPDVKVLAG